MSTENTALVGTETGSQQNLTRTRSNISGIFQKARHPGLPQAYPDPLPSSGDTVPPRIEFLNSVFRRPNSQHFCSLRGIPAAGWLSDVACGWAFAHSLAISLQAVGARVGQVSQGLCRSNSGNFIAQKWHSPRRGEREELIVVCLHTLTKLLLMNQREKSGGDLGRSQKAHFCQQIWTFAIMLWPDASHCFMCYLIKTYEFSIAVLESYLLRRYISPTPTGFGLYRYKSRVLRKAGAWVGIVSHEHFPAFWKSPTGQVPEGHWTTWQNWWQKGGKKISGKMKLLHCPAWKVKNCHFKIACAKGGSPTLGVSPSERTTVNIAICDVPGEGLRWCKGYYSFINIWLL